ncbi:sal-like protein 1 [Saccostrea cucullata]|uniref:sal-like protein 1 n=1 Tax=Saccostrea cuccullata TaxID=36930 RepID=UPI002ED0BB58
MSSRYFTMETEPVLSVQITPKIEPPSPPPESEDSGSHFSKAPSSEEIENAFHCIVSKTDVTPSDAVEGSLKVVTRYMCRYCARQFDSAEDMKKHIVSHTKPGRVSNHSCFVCGKTYSTPSKLQRHVRVHSGERPYPCHVCGRRFTRSDHVKQHLKTHLPQREKNTCRICSMKFNTRQALFSHLQVTHSINQIFTCDKCGEAFDNAEKLKSHKISHETLAQPTVTESADIEGAMLIQQNNANKVVDCENLMVIGLAKFSVSAAMISDMDEDMEDESNDGKSSSLSKASRKLDYTNGNDEESADKILNDADTIDTDGTMYISPELMEKFIKSEPMDDYEDSTAQGNSDGFQNSGIAVHSSDSKFVKDMWQNDSESEEVEKKPTVDESETAIHFSTGTKSIGNGRKVTEIMVYPKTGAKVTSYTEPITSQTLAEPSKIKLGPASYKAAVRKKLQMNYPYPRNTFKSLVKTLGINSNAVSVDKTNTTAPKQAESPAATSTTAPTEKKTWKCEHCSIYFEDYSMSLLHSSLHDADEEDPFTCRKCLKKLGNRLEFTAHLVWHLEPMMDG